MTGELIRYSAAATKTRALCGKRLTAEQWQQLAALRDIQSISLYLRNTPAWGEAVSACEDMSAPEALKKALAAQIEADYKALCRYLPRENDRKMLSLYLRRGEHMLSMENEDYAEAWSFLKQAYRGLSRRALEKLVGQEADLLNVIYLLRLRRFPGSAPDGLQRLIPVRGELKDKLARALLSAKTDERAAELLAGTPWSALGAALASPGALERIGAGTLDGFCRKIVGGADPTMAVPAAWLTLRTMDKQKLERMIDAVSCGLDPAAVL